MATATRRHHRDESDLVLLELIRLTTAGTWAGDHAGRALLAKGHSRGALRLAQARVQRARAAITSVTTERAAQTLAIALSLSEQPAH